VDDDELWSDEPAPPRRPPRPRRSDREAVVGRADRAPGGGGGRRQGADRGRGPEAGARVVRPPDGEPAAAPRAAPPRRGTHLLVPAICLLAGLLVGGAGAAALVGRDEAPAPAPAAPTSAPVGPSVPSAPPAPATTTTVAPPTTAAAPATTQAPTPQGSIGEDLARAQALAPLTMPSDCGLPFGVAESLPNGARAYRGGVHEGIDFICGERGRDAVAALDGQVVVANGSYEDPTNPEREEILATAKALGRTPPWTLAMLFGRVVVIDHGIRPNVGHVVTIYAHLEQIDPAIRPGLHVTAGRRLGEIGNRGTETAATRGTRPQSLHLHWEIHIDDHFLAEGATVEETDRIYRALFGR